MWVPWGWAATQGIGVKLSRSPTLRLRVPSPLVGEGQGEGAYGNTTTDRPSPRPSPATREREQKGAAKVSLSPAHYQRQEVCRAYHLSCRRDRLLTAPGLLARLAPALGSWPALHTRVQADRRPCRQ